jgi:hypothetical protein
MNLSPEVATQLYKYKSIDLCSGVPGQIFVNKLNIMIAGSKFTETKGVRT